MKKTWSRACTSVVAVGSLALLGAVPASAAVATTVSVGPSATLGLQGASVSVQMTVTCELASVINYGFVEVQQRVGRTLVRGGADSFNNVACTGSPQTVTLVVQTRELAFKRGKAVANAFVSVYDGSSYIDASISGQALSIK